MKIGFAADTYKPYISGVTNYISLHKAELERRGHEVTLITFGDPKTRLEEPRVIQNPGFRLKMGYSFGLRYSPDAREALKRMDIVHLHHPFITGQLVLNECQPLGIPLVFTGHTRYDQFFHDYLPWVPNQLGVRILKSYLPGFCRKMNRVISNSKASAEGLRNCGIDVPLTMLPNGVDLAPFLKAKFNPELRRKLAGDAETVFLYVGRLAVEKNLPMLFEAFRQVCSKFSVHLVMVGTGPLLEKMKADAARLGIASYITFTGLVNYALLPQYFAVADAFVMPSIHDAHPLAILETLGAGLPIVAVQSPAYSDTVDHGLNGLLQTNDAGNFAAGLELIASDPAKRKEMGQRSREKSGQFSVQHTAGLLLDLYQEVIEEQRGR